MTEEAQRIAIAELCNWRRWRFGDPYLEGLRLADKRFNGFIRTVTQVCSYGVMLNVDESPIYPFDAIERNFVPVNFWLNVKGEWWKDVPNYPFNLNACHEMEKVLTKEQRIDYIVTLLPLTGTEQKDLWFCAHATAAQRCKAFLKTLGKWDDSK